MEDQGLNFRKSGSLGAAFLFLNLALTTKEAKNHYTTVITYTMHSSPAQNKINILMTRVECSGLFTGRLVSTTGKVRVFKRRPQVHVFLNTRRYQYLSLLAETNLPRQVDNKIKAIWAALVVV